MVGDVGGFYDFCIIVLAPLLSTISEKFLLSKMTQKLFHGALEPLNPKLGPKEHLNAIRPLSFSKCFVLFKSLRRRGLRHQALSLGVSRVDRALDVVNLVR